MNFDHRAYIIKWSSIWIFVPFLFWIFNENRAPLYSAVFLPITGVASMIHWNNNNTGDWRHNVDIISSVTLVILLSIRLIQIHTWLCIFLLIGICLLFVIQRYLQMDRTLSWDVITYIHLLFHQFIFLLAMAVHSPNIYWVIFITILIVIHTMYISYVPTEGEYYDSEDEQLLLE